MFRLLMTGSRYQRNAEIVWSPLFWELHKHEQMIVVHGGCVDGVDAHTKEWINLPGHPWNRSGYDSKFLVIEEEHAVTPKMWREIGRTAGPQRNQRMVDAGADACFGFPDSRHRSGTLDCMARAWVKGIPVFCFNYTRVGVFHQITEQEGETLARRILGWGS